MSRVGQIRQELDEHRQVMGKVALEMTESMDEVVTLVLKTFRAEGKLLFCGNGGSAADAQHLAAEYVVRFERERMALPALALTADTSVLTAAGNDLGFDAVFERQVRALGRAGDLLFLHSTSGESENLLSAAEAARELGLGTVALLGKGGGRLRDRVDVALVVPTDSAARAQEAHITIGHIVCALVERAGLEASDLGAGRL